MQDQDAFKAQREAVLARYAPIDSWAEVQRMAKAGTFLWYHAPLDVYPTPIRVVRLFKNGKIRISGGGVAFTADEGHLNRFRKRAHGGA